MSLEESLAAIELLVDKVSAALLAADSLALEKDSTALRDAAARFARTLEQSQAAGSPLPPALGKRLDAVAEMLVIHREGLARLSANTDRQAAGLLPPADTSTYGTPGNTAARIYRAAG